MPSGALIGVDWGTSNLRAFLIDSAGNVLDRRERAEGILHVEGGAFADVLAACIGDWLGGRALPVILSGMIGSRQGWREAPYVETPAGAEALAAALIPVSFDAAEVRIVGGVKTSGPDVPAEMPAVMPDVMRGEETQVLGAMAALGIETGQFVLPGTHSKWVTAEAGRITGFATYMTGEVYGALRGHTILGALMRQGPEDAEAFRRGVEDGARAGTPGALLHRLFGVRTRGLFDQLSGGELPDYLSGLLIGAEIADRRDDAGPVIVIATETLAERYRAAGEIVGVTMKAAPEDCAALGHMAIARLAGVL